MTALDADEERHAELVYAERCAAAARVFTLTDRVLSGNAHVEVEVVDDKRLAYTDGEAIFLSQEALRTFSLREIGSVAGLNLHELAHVMYTPRAHWLGKEEAELWDAYNQLEDQRVETILVGKFPSTARMLTLAVGRYLLQRKGHWDVYPLVAGRWYLPAETRQALRDTAIMVPKFDEVDRIVTAYRSLSLKEGVNPEAKVLVQAWHDLKLDTMGDETAPIPLRRGYAAQWAQREGQGRAEQLHPTSGMLSGTTPRKSHGVHKILEDLLEATLRDSDTRQELAAQQRSIISSPGSGAPIERAGVPSTTPDPSYLAASQRFGRELRGLLQASQPGWMPRESSGRLNTQRALQGGDPSEMFDSWSEGNEGIDLETVVLVDRSGSMRGDPIWQACQAGWAILRALRGHELGSSLYFFGDHATRGWGPKDHVGTSALATDARGGTVIAPALEQAETVFHATRRDSKLLVILTDGQWFDLMASEKILGRMQRSGVVVAVAYLDNEFIPPAQDSAPDSPGALRAKFGHGADVFTQLDRAQDLVPFARQLVMKLLRGQVAVA